jgi:hypothetical protein
VIVLKTAKTGQTIVIQLRAPLSTGGEPTVAMTSYSGTELASGTATYDDTEWTTSAASGRGVATPKLISLVAPGEGESAITPGPYFLIAAAGHWEKVRVVSGAATSAQLATPPQLAYPAGSVLMPAEAVYTIPDAAVAAADDFAVNVVYYTGDRNELVAYNEEGTISGTPALCPVTPSDIYKIWPQLASMQSLNTTGLEVQERLDACWENVRSTLMTIGVRPEAFKATAALKQVLIYEFALRLALGGIDPTGAGQAPTFRDMIDRTLKSKWDQLYTTKQYVDQSGLGGKSGPEDTQRMSGRSIEW